MSRYAGILEAANKGYSDRLSYISEANNPKVAEIVKTIHAKRQAIKDNDRGLEAKLNKKIEADTLKMAKPVISRFNKELKAFLKSKENEISRELAGFPIRLLVSGGQPYSKGSNNSPNAIWASPEINFILDPVAE